jgi:hypothetical protein
LGQEWDKLSDTKVDRWSFHSEVKAF